VWLCVVVCGCVWLCVVVHAGRKVCVYYASRVAGLSSVSVAQTPTRDGKLRMSASLPS
jgi:hypothetical protein